MEAPAESPLAAAPVETRRWLRALLAADAAVARVDGAVVIAATALAGGLAALLVLLRNSGTAASPWLDVLPRIMTITLGFFGAALATSHKSHIGIDLASRLLRPEVARWVRFAADAVSAVVSLLLAWACWQFIAIEREAGSDILGLLPSWVPALALLWGFLFAGLRFIVHAAACFPPALALLPLVALGLAPLAGAAPGVALALGAVGVAAAVVTGAPLFVVLGGATLLLFWHSGAELAIVPIEIYRLTEAPALVALPLFTLVGAVLAKGGAPGRLLRVGRALLGWLPGGLLVATVLVCAFFTTFTGASGVTILALGLLLRQVLSEEKYSDACSVGLITSSGSIGLLWPPALPLIVYGIVGRVEIDQLFRAGVLPGAVLVGAVSLAAVAIARRRGPLPRHPFDAREALGAVRAGFWELLLPLVILGSWLAGVATVVEASALGASYAVLVSLLRRDVDLGGLLRAMRESGTLIGAVLIILGVAVAFTGYLIDEQIPQFVVEWTRANVESRWAFLLALNLLLLVVGCLLDIFSAIIVFVPLVAPVAAAFGVDPVHLAIVFLANLEIGYLTPPVGMNLFLSSFRFKLEMPEIWRAAWPYLVVLLAALLVITYVPVLSTVFVTGSAPAGLP